jgi:hypothetical protein
MIKAEESRMSALGALTIEMTSLQIAASAQETMHPVDGRKRNRKLVIIHEELFQRYARSWSGCRFSRADLPADIPKGVTLFEILRVAREQRHKQFADHTCSERPHFTGELS